jgi:hypothetical protein
VHHRSYSPGAPTQQRHNSAAHTTDSPAAGTGHQDETRLSHLRLPSSSLPSRPQLFVSDAREALNRFKIKAHIS